MILFPDDVQAIEELTQQQAEAIKNLLARQIRLDPELTKACQEHVEHGQYSDAIFKAFRVLEGRIQQRSGVLGQTAVKTLHVALKADGPLTKQLGLSSRQAAGYRDLLIGAFAFFRNPEAHPGEVLVDYGSSECYIVLGFVNMVLSILDRKPETPLDVALKHLSARIGLDTTHQVKGFLKQVRQLNVKQKERSASFVYRAHAFRRPQHEGPPKIALVTIFSLNHKHVTPTLSFAVHSQWPLAVGLDIKPFIQRLISLGGIESRRYGSVYFDLREPYDDSTFDRLYAIVRDVVHAIEATVTAQQGKGQ